jgi:3-phenylpropionate/trans-cinnamate dioxygenase ferredoxin reductase subunit
MSDAGAHVVVLGAGQAACELVTRLRNYGFEGPITLVGDEPIPPYQRPPLSKAWLKGEADADSLALKPLEFYAEHAIDFRPGTTAVAIDRAAKTVALSDGSTLGYDILVVATGATPIVLPLPGKDLEGILYLRTAADAEALKLAIAPGKRVAVVGGGYIGLEVAASARALGAEAIAIERENRLLARPASPEISAFMKAYHEAKGVEVLVSTNVVGFEGEGGRVTGVRLGDGRVAPCDIALVGVGASPNDKIAEAAGLECTRGVVVDGESRTSDPSIFAIGDVAQRPMPLYDRMFRPESVPSALEQAKQAAAAIAGRPAPAPEAPWNWSDQYDLKLQFAGLPFDVDRRLVRGDPAQARFAVFHLNGDRIQMVEAVNAPAEFMAGRQYILNRKPIDPEKLADPSVSMKEVGA